MILSIITVSVDVHYFIVHCLIPDYPQINTSVVGLGHRSLGANKIGINLTILILISTENCL